MGDSKLQMILAERQQSRSAGGSKRRWTALLKLPQTWGTIFARGLKDPVWFFITDWFPIYLVAKGISLRSGLIAVWVPFIAADLGNFFGAIASGYLIKRGWRLGAARNSMVVFGGFGMMLLIPTIFNVNLWIITALFAFSTFAYAAFSTIANVLPSDLFHSDSVASVSGGAGRPRASGRFSPSSSSDISPTSMRQQPRMCSIRLLSWPDWSHLWV